MGHGPRKAQANTWSRHPKDMTIKPHQPEYWNHVEQLQLTLLAYAQQNSIGSATLQEMITTLLCTIAIRNGKTVSQVLPGVHEEFSKCVADWAQHNEWKGKQ
jgi:hypothetical protein